MAERTDPDVAEAGAAFGTLLRRYRVRALLSQERLAERAGLTSRAIRNLEQGGVRPRGESVRLLGEALGLTGSEREAFLTAARGPSAGRPASQPPVPAHGGRPPCQLPADVADFTGRDEVAARLRGLLARPGDGRPTAVVVSAVAGTAGVGKSALAVHVAHQLVQEFPDGQLYAGLNGAGGGVPLDPAEVLGRFLRALGVDGAALPATEQERAALYRSRLAGMRVLVVLDDAADEAQVRPLLPGSPGAAVLVTSRARLTALEGARLVQLDVLDPEQAVALLARIAGAGRVAAEPAAAASIVAACGGLPLAVRIAGARLAARPHWPLRRLAELLADERGRLDELAHGDLEVRASLEVSYRGLDAEQRRLFRRLGLLEAPDVAGWVAGALLDSPLARAEELLEGLVDAQLVTVAGWDGCGRTRYRLHDLLGAYARERVLAEEPAAERQAALERAVGGWLALAELADRRLPTGSLVGDPAAAAGWLPDPAVAEELVGDPAGWFEAERAALLSAIRQASIPEPTAAPEAVGRLARLAWGLAAALAGFLQLQAYRDDFRRACDLALTATRRAGDRQGEGWVLVALAELAGDQDRFDDAMALAEQARRIHRAVGDRRGEAYATFVAANVHDIRGRYGEAVGELQRAWQLYTEVADAQGRAWVLHNLGRVHRNQGSLDEAATCLEQALAASHRAGDRRSEALVLLQLGQLEQTLDRPDRASACLHDSLRICRELGDRLGEGFVLRTLGHLLRHQGAFGSAASTFEEALEVFRRIGSRRGEAAVLQGLGELQYAQGDPCQARTCLEAALVVLRELELTTLMAQTLTTLSEVQADTGDHAAARRSRHEARALSRALAAPPGAATRPAKPPAATVR